MQNLSPNLRFSVIYLGVMALLAGIFWALETFADKSVGSGMGAVLPLVSGLMAGQYAARAAGGALDSKTMWRDAFVFSVIAVVLPLVVAAVLIGVAGLGSDISAMLAYAGVGVLALSLIAAFILSFLMIRLGYGLGIRNEVKLLEKRAK